MDKRLIASVLFALPLFATALMADNQEDVAVRGGGDRGGYDRGAGADFNRGDFNANSYLRGDVRGYNQGYNAGASSGGYYGGYYMPEDPYPSSAPQQQQQYYYYQQPQQQPLPSQYPQQGDAMQAPSYNPV